MMIGFDSLTVGGLLELLNLYAYDIGFADGVEDSCSFVIRDSLEMLERYGNRRIAELTQREIIKLLFAYAVKTEQEAFRRAKDEVCS